MAKNRTKRKISWKKVICGVLVVILAIACIGGISSCLKEDKTKEISSSSFAVGGVDPETGKHVNRTDAVYTEKLVACAGLSVIPEFDANSKYQIFWYNMDEIYLGCTELSDAVFSGKVNDYAKYCRIMIVPEEAANDNEYEIGFFDKYDVADSVKISVNKDQGSLPVDYYELAKQKKAPSSYDHGTANVADGYEYYADTALWASETNNTFTKALSKNEGDVTIKLDCSDVKSYKVTLGSHQNSKSVSWAIVDADGNILYTDGFESTPGDSVVIEIPESFTVGDSAVESKYIVFSVLDVVKPIVINKYLPRA